MYSISGFKWYRFAAICCLLAQCREWEEGQCSKGVKEECVHMHLRYVATRPAPRVKERV